MSKASKKQKPPKLKFDESELEYNVNNYLASRQILDGLKADFETVQQLFYDYIEEYALRNDLDIYDGVIVDSQSKEGGTIKVKKIQSSKVIFDVDALLKVLPKKVATQVIKKRVMITNVEAFTKYMKEIGASQSKVSKCLSVENTVDENALNKLYDIGEITAGDDLHKCYEVRQSKPYYTVREQKSDGQT